MNVYSNDASWANKTEANIIFREGGCTFIELFDHIPKNHISIPKKVWNWKIMLHNCYGWEKNMLIALYILILWKFKCIYIVRKVPTLNSNRLVKGE